MLDMNKNAETQQEYFGKTQIVAGMTIQEDVLKLRMENEQLRNNGFTVSAMTEQQLKVAIEKGEQLEKRITELEKENGHLKQQNFIYYNEREYNNKIQKQLREQIEKMKADVKQGQSYWNSGEMQYGLYQKLLDKWEIKENANLKSNIGRNEKV